VTETDKQYPETTKSLDRIERAIEVMRKHRKFADPSNQALLDEMEDAVQELRKVATTLLSIPVLSEQTGIPERTLRGAFDRQEIPYEVVGRKVRASTIEAVEAWKNNPEYHKRGRRKVSKKSV